MIIKSECINFWGHPILVKTVDLKNTHHYSTKAGWEMLHHVNLRQSVILG